jgi:hypothetical protein
VVFDYPAVQLVFVSVEVYSKSTGSCTHPTQNFSTFHLDNNVHPDAEPACSTAQSVKTILHTARLDRLSALQDQDGYASHAWANCY